MAAYDVFISYSTANKAVADAVVADFEQHNIRCFYAPRNIPPGVEWASAITAALNAASVCILIFTAESNASKQVKNEVAMAFNAEKTIIPFKLTNEALSDEMQYYLARVHWLDATTGLRSRKIQELRETVQRTLHKTPEPEHGKPGTATPGGVKPGTANPGAARQGGANPGAERPWGANPSAAIPRGTKPSAENTRTTKLPGLTWTTVAPARSTGNIKRKFIFSMVIAAILNMIIYISLPYEFTGKESLPVGFITASLSTLIVLRGRGSTVSRILGAITAFVSSFIPTLFLTTFIVSLLVNVSVLIIPCALVSIIIAGYIANWAAKCAKSLKK
ncbi:MAG: toll/interleukin-1 receptor domain-containing protein [Lachnospiraceae bacterium]|nr:toll/interleukin-1 receptor domain-containing protein [Lachnospiraceae bacterium]